ncbi:MAG: helix-turn-helix domain-containing protein [Acidimicrobiia bacterium]
MTTIHTARTRRPRADALRNAERLRAAAWEVFDEQGADASLEEIARRAGVGIGTLYRHFPTRDDLVIGMFTDRVAASQALADELATSSEPGDAFATWLRGQLHEARACRGLGAAAMIKMLDGDAPSPCEALRESGALLLARAQASGDIGPHVDIDDVLLLVNAIGLATDDATDTGQASRLLDVMIDGLRRSP